MDEKRYQIVTQNKQVGSAKWDDSTFTYAGDGDLDAAKLEFDQEMGMFLVEEALDTSTPKKTVLVNKTGYSYTLLGFEFEITSTLLWDREAQKAVSRE